MYDILEVLFSIRQALTSALHWIACAKHSTVILRSRNASS